jgi:hypothetical protein
MSVDENKGWIEFDDAVRLIMQKTGRTRRQAKALLIEQCRQGNVKAMGVGIKTGRKEIIPPAAFPAVN